MQEKSEEREKSLQAIFIRWKKYAMNCYKTMRRDRKRSGEKNVNEKVAFEENTEIFLSLHNKLKLF
jgi:hypothetical protein